MNAIKQSRNSVAAILAAATIGLAGQPAAAAEKVNYLIPAPKLLPAFAPWILAKSLGYYKADGYDVTFVRAKGGVDVAKQVGAGNAPVGGGIGDTPIIVRANGIPVRSVAVLGGGALMVVVARGDRGITSPRMLKGKTVTVMSYQDTTYYALLGTLYSVGLKKSDVKIVAVGPRNVPGFVIAGKADACACVPDWEIYVRGALKNKVVAMPSQRYFPSMAQAILASDKIIKTNPKLVRSMVQGTLKAVRFMMKKPAKAAAAYVKAMPVHKGKEKLMTLIFRNFTRRTYAGQTTLGEMDPIQLGQLQDFYLKQGIIRRKTPVSQLYTNQFVK
jgi:NitT/TauT family transport system substrate-binding protein